MTLRPAVQGFAERMEANLRRHDERGTSGWDDETIDFLKARLHEEVDELVIALHMSKAYPGEYKRRARDEAADVANFAMMIADVV